MSATAKPLSASKPPPQPLPLRVGRALWRGLCVTGHWLGCWLLYTSVVLLIGTLLGMVLFVVVGQLSHPQLSVLYRAQHGAMDGAWYGGVWAGGIGIIACFIRGHRDNAAARMRAQQQAAGSAGSAACCTGSSADGACSAEPVQPQGGADVR